MNPPDLEALRVLLLAWLRHSAVADQAEDIAQDVLFAIWDQYVHGQEIKNWSAFATVIVRRRLIDELRRRRREPRLFPDEVLESVPASVDLDLPGRPSVATVLSRLGSDLSQLERRVLMAIEANGAHATADLAAALGYRRTDTRCVRRALASIAEKWERSVRVERQA